jgi:L-seryl-tRNA(Ser) seleniumtransferase
MATEPLTSLRDRAQAIAEATGNGKVVDTEAVAGGGSLPGLGIPSVGVALDDGDADDTAARLREHGVVARVADGMVVCDLRTVEPGDDATLITALRAASGRADE